MIALETREIGGGIVRRFFTSADTTHRAGEKLTAEQILAWPEANRRALIANRFIEVYPAESSVPAAKNTTIAPARKAARA